MNKLKRIIQRNINGSKVLLLFIITNIVYAFMLFITIPKVMQFSGGMKLLDMMPTGYTLEYVKMLFTTLGYEGQNLYLTAQIPADMVYPLLFGISYCLLLAFFLNKLNKLNGLLFYACLLPLVAGITDYLENIGIVSMLISFPDISNILAVSTSAFSIIKSIFTTIYFIVLLITLIVLGIKFIGRKK